MSSDSSDSSDSSKGLGNTKPAPKKKQISPKKRWCFTWNNYPKDWVVQIVPILHKSDLYSIGEEIGEEGTPHLQGYFEFHRRVRPIGYLKLSDKIHWEPTLKGRQANLDYTQKDGKFIQNFEEKLETITNLYPYQQEMIDIIKKKPEARKIYWFYGPKNIGKTEILFKMCAEYKTHILPVTKRHALSQVYMTNKDIDVYAMNLTADESAYQSNDLFSILESIKDRMFSAAFGTKCNGMCMFNHKHLIVVANSPPDWSKTEIDKERFVIREISDKII